MIATDSMAQTRTESPHTSAASIRARTGGYVVDMVIFSALAMVIVVMSGTILLLRTNGATADPSDNEVYTFLAIIGVGVPAAWTVLNVALLAMRAQTGGQYVAGVRLLRSDGARPTIGNVLVWWICLNPLLFSWPMAVTAGFPLAVVTADAASSVSLAFFATLVTLCLIAPAAALISALLDARNRGLHDRIVGTLVVPIEQA